MRVGARCVTGNPLSWTSRRLIVRSPVARVRSSDGVCTLRVTSTAPLMSSSAVGSMIPRNTAGVMPVAVACSDAGAVVVAGAGVKSAIGADPVAVSIAPSYDACASRRSSVSRSRCARTMRFDAVERSRIVTEPGPASRSATTTGLSSDPVTRASSASGPDPSVTGTCARPVAVTARAASPMSPVIVRMSPSPFGGPGRSAPRVLGVSSNAGRSPDAERRVAPASTSSFSTLRRRCWYRRRAASASWIGNSPAFASSDVTSRLATMSRHI